MRLRLYHHGDGARIAYREAGTGPPLVLLHAAGLSHREWEPIVEPLAARFRLVMPDLPLHGDSEDRARHPYSPEWLVEVLGGFCARRPAPNPIAVGHGAGAELLLRGSATARSPAPARAHAEPHARTPRAARGDGRVAIAARAGVVPGLDRAFSHAVALAVRPTAADRLTVQRTRPPATSSATRSPTSRGTATAPAAGRVPPAAGRAGRSPTCSRPTRASTCRSCSSGPTRTPAPGGRGPGGARAPPRRPALRAAATPGTSSPTTTPSAWRGRSRRSAADRRTRRADRGSTTRQPAPTGHLWRVPYLTGKEVDSVAATARLWRVPPTRRRSGTGRGRHQRPVRRGRGPRAARPDVLPRAGRRRPLVQAGRPNIEVVMWMCPPGTTAQPGRLVDPGAG